MITKVKRNAQRVSYTKPSYIENALNERNGKMKLTNNYNLKSRENTHYYRKDIPTILDFNIYGVKGKRAELLMMSYLEDRYHVSGNLLLGEL